MRKTRVLLTLQYSVVEYLPAGRQALTFPSYRMGRLRETTGHDMDEYGNGADAKSEKALHSDATADDLSTLGNGDSGPLDADISFGDLATEVVTTAMTEEDERIAERLISEFNPGLKIATDWLMMLNGQIKIDDPRFEEVAKTVPLRLSSPAVTAYIRHITQGKRLQNGISTLLNEVEVKIHDSLLRPFEIDQTEAQVFREAGIGES